MVYVSIFFSCLGCEEWLGILVGSGVPLPQEGQCSLEAPHLQPPGPQQLVPDPAPRSSQGFLILELKVWSHETPMRRYSSAARSAGLGHAFLLSLDKLRTSAIICSSVFPSNRVILLAPLNPIPSLFLRNLMQHLKHLKLHGVMPKCRFRTNPFDLLHIKSLQYEQSI